MAVTHGLNSANSDLVSAVEYLYDVGELRDILTLIHFIERPSRYPELIEIWEDYWQTLEDGVE